jgi:DNA-binding transcriptional MerR regulator
MRGAGMPVEVLIEYVSLFQQGDETRQARKDLLIEQRRIMAEKVDEMNKTIERLDYKIANYEKTLMVKEKELKREEHIWK